MKRKVQVLDIFKTIDGQFIAITYSYTAFLVISFKQFNKKLTPQATFYMIFASL